MRLTILSLMLALPLTLTSAAPAAAASCDVGLEVQVLLPSYNMKLASLAGNPTPENVETMRALAEHMQQLHPKYSSGDVEGACQDLQAIKDILNNR